MDLPAFCMVDRQVPWSQMSLARATAFGKQPPAPRGRETWDAFVWPFIVVTRTGNVPHDGGYATGRSRLILGCPSPGGIDAAH
jgi:hypothetical protein